MQLGVLELVRGLALMAAAAPAAGPQPEAPHLGPIGAAVAGLMRFPAVTPTPTTALSCPSPALAPAVLAPHHLAEPESLDLLQHAARAAALRHMQQLQLQHAGASDPGRAAQAAELAGFEVKLQATRVALHAIARQALSRGHVLPHAGQGHDVCQHGQQQQQDQQVEEAEGEAMALLVSLERLLCSLVEQWAALKAYEEAAAEEEAQQFKTKTNNSTFLNDDAEAEVDYRVQFPDHYAAFKDVAPVEGEVEPEEEEEERGRGGQEQGGEEEGPATAAQAKSSGARQLLDGELLADVVRLHAAVYGVLAERQQQQAAGEAAGSVGVGANGRDALGAEAEAAFLRSYQLGSELMAAVGFRLGAELDGEVETGHLFRLCVEHNKLNRAAAATAAEAAAAGVGGAGGRKAASGSSKRAKGDVIFGEEDSGVDIQQACVEISLMQVGEAEEWPAPLEGKCSWGPWGMGPSLGP